MFANRSVLGLSAVLAAFLATPALAGPLHSNDCRGDDRGRLDCDVHKDDNGKGDDKCGRDRDLKLCHVERDDKSCGTDREEHLCRIDRDVLPCRIDDNGCGGIDRIVCPKGGDHDVCKLPPITCHEDRDLSCECHVKIDCDNDLCRRPPCGGGDHQPPPPCVPEPASLLLFGLLGLGAIRRKLA